jgi:hypothetical protein
LKVAVVVRAVNEKREGEFDLEKQQGNTLTFIMMV